MEMFKNEVQGDCTIPEFDAALLKRVARQWDRRHRPPSGAWACENAAGDVLQVVDVDQTPGSRSVYVLEHRPVIVGRSAWRAQGVWYQHDALTGAAFKLAQTLFADRDARLRKEAKRIAQQLSAHLRNIDPLRGQYGY